MPDFYLVFTLKKPRLAPKIKYLNAGSVILRLEFLRD